jgi:hypothetical protein
VVHIFYDEDKELESGDGNFNRRQFQSMNSQISAHQVAIANSLISGS